MPFTDKVLMDERYLTYTEQRRIWKKMLRIKWFVIYGLIMHSHKLFPGSYLVSSIQCFESILPYLFINVEVKFSYQQRRAYLILEVAPRT